MRIPDDSVDVVLCAEVLEHLESPLDALQNIYRVLSPRGRVLLGVPNESLNLFIKKTLQKLGLANVLGKLSPGMAMGHLQVFNKHRLTSVVDPKLFEIQRIFYDKPFFLNIYALLRPKK
jgi:2-polyprenyl-3-methyl-5-hydroxy-6-metoxy-1,4-benzoquinol methylase